jgi:hypothetical protein
LTALAICAAGAARADDCEVRAAKIVADAGASVIRRSSADTILLKIEPYEITLECNKYLSVFIGAGTRLPPSEFLTIAAIAGSAVVDAPVSTIRDGVAKCQQAALRDPNKYNHKPVNFPYGQILCAAKPEASSVIIQPPW